MLTDKVYSDLKKKILSLSLKPGSPLSFSALKPLYKVSISPIRDALKALESEGLVEIKPQSGTFVSLIDLEKVRDERFSRLYLELGAIENAGKNGFGDELASEWERLLDDQKAAYSCRNTGKFLELDDSMHSLFFKKCNHIQVFESMKNSSGNYHRIRMVSYLFDDILQNILVQHQGLLDAIRTGNPDAVIALDRKHISKIETETSDYQKAFPEYFKK